ncbi:hypothetical protein CA606_01545 [Caulobacter vibrioides]|uniref:Lipoprotein n=1 Tax=Caulobacter vibrioides TaxID=155892 RepID=A0A290MS24_CAUVI|nr:hypothetical protein [Caulobacter vibrioides]ATC31135.1 hypothetical protein CA606_01545 [Caulobacter vibrioides]
MRKTVLALAVAGLALASCGPSDPGKPEGGLMLGLRAIFAFKTCTDKLEERFGLKEIAGVTSNDMDPQPTGRPGEWDVKFTADVTEKESGRVTRYKGVCRVRRDQPTTLDASFVKELKAGTDVVRRVRPG